MHYTMRRRKQELDRETCEDILRRNTSGTLALCGADGEPYAVPLSYAFTGTSLVFHSALQGRKIDAIAQNGRASFCVIDQDDVVPEEFTTRYRSAIAFGSVHIVENDTERQRSFATLGERYWPGHAEETAHAAATSGPRAAIIELRIEHLTGKESRELARQRELRS